MEVKARLSRRMLRRAATCPGVRNENSDSFVGNLYSCAHAGVLVMTNGLRKTLCTSTDNADAGSALKGSNGPQDLSLVGSICLFLEHTLNINFELPLNPARVGATALLAACLSTAMIGNAAAQSGAEPAKDAAPSDFAFSANVSVASQYRVRGLMQTNSEPAIQGGLDLSHSSGFYVGNWNSSITWLSDSAPVEMDFYGGYTRKIMGDLTADVGAIRYYYPGSYPGSLAPNTTELYLGLGYGAVSFKYSQSLTNLFGIPESKGSQYYDFKGSVPTGVWGLMVDGHVGYQKVSGMADASYTDWLLGVSKSWDNGFSASLAYIDTNADHAIYTNRQGKYMGRSTVLLSVTKKF